MLYIPKTLLLLFFWIAIAILLADAASEYPDHIPLRIELPREI